MPYSLRSAQFWRVECSNPIEAAMLIESVGSAVSEQDRRLLESVAEPVEVVASGPVVGRGARPVFWFSDGALEFVRRRGTAIAFPKIKVAASELPPYDPVLLT